MSADLLDPFPLHKGESPQARHLKRKLILGRARALRSLAKALDDIARTPDLSDQQMTEAAHAMMGLDDR